MSSGDMDCLFCKIARKEIPAYIVAEDAHTVSFLDIHPRAPGHTMVISKVHSATLLDLPEPEVSALFNAVRSMVRRLVRAVGAHGLSIGINQGAVTGQEVAHLHVHLMPRFEGDGGRPVQSLVENAPKQSFDEMVEKIKAVPLDPTAL